MEGYVYLGAPPNAATKATKTPVANTPVHCDAVPEPMTPLMQHATESQKQLRLLRGMQTSGPPARRLGDPHPEVHRERLLAEQDILAGLEEDGLSGAGLIKAAAEAKQEYEMELSDLLVEAEEAVAALREQIAPGMGAPPPTPSFIPAAPPPAPPPGPVLDDLLGFGFVAPPPPAAPMPPAAPVPPAAMPPAAPVPPAAMPPAAPMPPAPRQVAPTPVAPTPLPTFFSSAGNWLSPGTGTDVLDNLMHIPPLATPATALPATTTPATDTATDLTDNIFERPSVDLFQSCQNPFPASSAAGTGMLGAGDIVDSAHAVPSYPTESQLSTALTASPTAHIDAAGALFGSPPLLEAPKDESSRITSVEQMPPASREGLAMLQKGHVATKFGRQGKPHSVMFKLSEDLTTLSWERKGFFTSKCALGRKPHHHTRTIPYARTCLWADTRNRLPGCGTGGVLAGALAQ